MPNIDIKIRRKRPVRRSNASHKPPVDIRREADYLKRRLRPKGINFYDMGQIADGSGGWIDTDFIIEVDPINPGPPGENLIPPPTQSDYDSRDAPLLAIPTDQWLTKFRKITKGALSMRYGLYAQFGTTIGDLDTLSEWTSGGLVVPQAELDEVFSAGPGSGLAAAALVKDISFYPLAPNIKITTTPLYSDPDAVFTPIPKMDVFFMPIIGGLGGFSWTRPSDYIFDDYGFIAMTFPRRFAINTDDEYGGVGNLGVGTSPPVVGGSIPSATAAAISNWKSIIPGRDYHFNLASTTWTPGTGFPGTGTGANVFIGFNGQLASSGFQINGELCAVIKKGDTFYYFWTTGY